MNTLWLLLGQYGGKPFIPIDVVCRDFFPHLETAAFVRKIAAGDIALPVTRADASQKSAKTVAVQDLADYLDKRREAALKECRQLNR